MAFHSGGSSALPSTPLHLPLSPTPSAPLHLPPSPTPSAADPITTMHPLAAHHSAVGGPSATHHGLTHHHHDLCMVGDDGEEELLDEPIPSAPQLPLVLGVPEPLFPPNK